MENHHALTTSCIKFKNVAILLSLNPSFIITSYYPDEIAFHKLSLLKVSFFCKKLTAVAKKASILIMPRSTFTSERDLLRAFAYNFLLSEYKLGCALQSVFWYDTISF